MARAQIKLLVFLITMGLAVGCAAAAWWIYTNLLNERFASEETKAAKAAQSAAATPRPPPDPGIRRFDSAVELIRGNKVSEGRDALYKLLAQFPASPTCIEAKRIIGEINMDALYAFDQSGGKKDYIVQPGNSLLSIAGKNQTTVEAIVRLNGLTSINLRLGDHLFLIPTNFEAIVDESSKTLILRTDGKFFKEYPVADIKFPPNTRLPSTMEVGTKSAVSTTGSVVPPYAPEFITAEKRVVLYKRSAPTAEFPDGKATTTVGLVVRALPQATEVVTPPPPPPPAAKAKGKAKQGSKKGSEDAAAEVDDTPDAAPTGLFLKREDMEEIYLLLRRATRFEFKP